MDSMIRDASLAPSGRMKIEWAKRHMPVLNSFVEDMKKTQPLKGITVTVCVHMEAKTAYLAQVLKECGAEVYAAGSNPLSTQDDVCAALSESGVHIYAMHGCSMEEFHEMQLKALACCPDVLVDDGGDLMTILHEEHPEWAVNLRGGCEETTTGIIRIRNRAKAGKLNFPMFAINDADCKHLFDNRYGTGQSAWDGILRTTNLNVAGTTVVVVGYGWCGKGVAMRAKGLGAKVIVTEVDPVCAIEAVMDGFEVMPMAEAAARGDFFVTVTGDCHVITPEHMQMMKDGAVLCNAGHFDIEIDVKGLRNLAVQHAEIRNNIEEYLLPNGRRIYLLAEGRLVNLAAADGHPVEIMDMSFALQFACALRMAQEGRNLKPALYPVPRDVDQEVAMRKLKAIGVSIDTLTEEQKQYLYGDC